MLWELFAVFLKIGLVSFGGGYAVLPLIQHEVSANGWLTEAQYQTAVSLAGMAPGPIATNSATLIGYETAGLAGAAFATLGMVLPSLAVVMLVSAFLFRRREEKWVKSSFYGLRPIVAGLIAYAAIHFAFPAMGNTVFTWTTVLTLAIAAGSLLAMIKYKLSPLAVVLAAGAAGIILF
ncbi:chromate transporter [Cohnella massiliensis]|uniref:chromate transporter n=1 Tax=Cohnella massiliensis TaxID=1816691 RepID=UPI0009BA3653|nr:chromate transporter [Cohnella massiliensis]